MSKARVCRHGIDLRPSEIVTVDNGVYRHTFHQPICEACTQEMLVDWRRLSRLVTIEVDTLP